MASRRVRLTLVYPGCLLIGALLATVTHGPARLAGTALKLLGEERVTLDNPGGTLWSGSADLVVRTPAATLRLPGIAWQIGVSEIWAGRLLARISSASAELNGEIGITLEPGSITLRTQGLHLAAGVIASQIPALAAIGPAADVQIDTPALALDHGQVKGEASIRVLDTRSTRLGAMGDYLIALTGTPDGVDFVASTLRGAVRLAGRGQAQMAGGFRFLGEVRADGPERERLTGGLASFGVPQADGSVRLAWPVGAGGPGSGERR